VPYLLSLKEGHEQRVRDGMRDAFAGVGFPELEEATAWVLRTFPNPSQESFALLAPDEKIAKNGLRAGSRAVVAMGLSVSREVGQYIESVTQTDPDFPERLKSGFLEEYYRLRREGYRDDDLFDLMCRFAQQGFHEQSKRSAGLAVLIHLFELCEVFEK
jgi:hypothetical protein